MAERAIQKKSNKQFLSSFAPVSASLDELVREKLECGKFPLTKTGWIKIIAVIVLLASLVLFLAQSGCPHAASWFPYLLPITLGAEIFIELLFYLIFSCGGTVSRPGRFVVADIILNLIFSLIAIIGSAMTTMEKIRCTENVTMHGIPGPLGIAGGIISVFGCVAIFLLYRYVDEEEDAEPPPPTSARIVDTRKSIHA